MKRSEFDKIVKESVRKALEEIAKEEDPTYIALKEIKKEVEGKNICPICGRKHEEIARNTTDPFQQWPSIPSSPWDRNTWSWTLYP